MHFVHASPVNSARSQEVMKKIWCVTDVVLLHIPEN